MTNSSVPIVLSILVASFLGSWHCAAMCGPIATFVAHRGKLLHYHTGRMLSYSLLGIFSGWLGSFFLKNDLGWLRALSGVLFSITLIFMGGHILLRNRPVHLFNSSFFQAFFTRKSSSFLLGLISVFLPCGWLYTFVLASAATQNATAGGIVLWFFWLGGLPALSAVPIFVQRSIALSNPKKQKAAGAILTIAGIYSLVSFYYLHP